MIAIRKEIPQDRNTVYDLNKAEFNNGPEAALVDKLRASCNDYLAFVAVDDGALPKASSVARYLSEFDDAM